MSSRALSSSQTAAGEMGAPEEASPLASTDISDFSWAVWVQIHLLGSCGVRGAEPASSQAHHEATAWLTVDETINPKASGQIHGLPWYRGYRLSFRDLRNVNCLPWSLEEKTTQLRGRALHFAL